MGIPKGIFKDSVTNTQGILQGLYKELQRIVQGFSEDCEGKFYKEHNMLWGIPKGLKRVGSARNSIRFNNDFDRGPERIL